MEIVLELEGQCIKTKTRNEYERLVSKCIKESKTKGDQGLLEEHIEGLKYFLEHADFGNLRAKYPALSGTRKKGVMITISGIREDMRIIHNKKEINLEGKEIENEKNTACKH